MPIPTPGEGAYPAHIGKCSKVRESKESAGAGGCLSLRK